MMNLIESSAGRIAAQIQSFGSHFDPEILSLPGGSIIAIVLWAYASAAPVLKRGPAKEVEPICSGCFGH